MRTKTISPLFTKPITATPKPSRKHSPTAKSPKVSSPLRSTSEWMSPTGTGVELQTQLNPKMDGVLNAKQNELKYIYFAAAIICVAVGMPLFFVGFKFTKERTSELDDINPPSLKHNLSLLFKNKPLMLIVISGILGAARMVFTYTGGLYFCKYVLDSVNFMGMHGEGLYTLVTIAIVPGGLIASLLVPYLTKKIGKKQSYIWTNIAGGVALLIAFIIGMAIDKGNYTSTATLVIALLAIVVSGIPSGLTNIVSYAMIGDTIEYLELKTGERAEGICFAMQTSSTRSVWRSARSSASWATILRASPPTTPARWTQAAKTSCGSCSCWSRR